MIKIAHTHSKNTVAFAKKTIMGAKEFAEIAAKKLPKAKK